MTSSKRNAARAADQNALSGSSEKVLKQITELYTTGLSGGAAGAVGLKSIGDDKLVGLPIRKPHKKVSVMIIGNHSAGKSSFINWYIGEQIQRTGVAIETRGFTFVTSGRKRETLTGDATVRFFDNLEGLSKFGGIIPNLFTEITTSKEKHFSCVDFIDTPGLVDGDMQYPFDVEEAILWLADHADVILIFFDPIGQATCKRTLSVVEKLNNGPHVEKIHYFMSKADAVELEHDRQRVLIQITQNLATRIRNSHAFNLPTFYLPKEDDMPIGIPNAIEDVCKEIEKAINMTVQKNLKVLRLDCQRIQDTIVQVVSQDKQRKSLNYQKKWKALALFLLAAAVFTALLAVFNLRWMEEVCMVASTSLCSPSFKHVADAMQPAVKDNFLAAAGVLLSAFAVLLGWAAFSWRAQPVLSSKDLKKLTAHKAVAATIAEQEQGLYDEYFKTLSDLEHR